MLSSNKLKRVLKNNGAENIAEESINLINEIVSKISEEITLIAVKLTRFKGAKTLQKDAIKVSIKTFLGRDPKKLEVKTFNISNIRNILAKSGAKRISKEAIDYMNKVISWIAEEIALNAVILTHTNQKKLVEEDSIKFGSQKFLGKDIEQNNVESV